MDKEGGPSLMEGAESGGSVDISNLANAIVQVFSIILLGYVAGRTGTISKVHADGIGRFVSRFCLPALIFRSMCVLDFSVVNWTFLLGICLAKGCVFLLVTLATVVVKRPFNLGLAGIFSIFATQSNDFALGYPIVDAIYQKSHPEYVKYLYLLAPFTLAVLIPIGFIMMEFQRTLNLHGHGQKGGFSQSLVKVLKGVAMNPIVNMTIIGIVFNFILNGSLPQMLDNIFGVLSLAFNAGALFFLGLSLVGKIQGQIGIGLVVPFLLVVAKTLVLPLFAWGILQRLDSSKNSTSFSMYGFLYGTIPTAPSVYIFASDYGFGQEIIATALVLGNALSAPFMFISAKMMTVMVDSGVDFKVLLFDTAFNISIVSLICCVWVIAIFIFTGKWKRIPHRFTMAYMVSHVIACIGAIVYNFHGEAEGWHSYPGMVLLMVGVLATRFWTAVIAMVLCILHVRSLCAVLRIQVWLYFVGFGLPLIMTGLLFILGNRDVGHQINPSFHYGTTQAIFSLSALLFCFGVTVTSLIWWQREERHHHTIQSRDYSSLVQETEVSSPIIIESGAANNGQYLQGSSALPQNSTGKSLPRAASIEDIMPFPETKSSSPVSDYSEMHSESLMEHISERTCLIGQCSAEQRHDCMDSLREYTSKSLNADYSFLGDEEVEMSGAQLMMSEYQSLQHLLMLLPLIFSMFVAVILCTWKLFKGKATGIYIEVEFLDIVLNYGQGVLVALVFGFESRIIFSPMLRRRMSRYRFIYASYVWLRRALLSTEVMQLPTPAELDEVTKHTCSQFTKYHLENCRKEIVRDRRFGTRTLNNVFTGTAMCDWLIECGLAADRSAAVEYGCHLVLGRVISHIASQQNFHDALYFYRFLETYEQLPV
ncbi:integral membrane protein gpr155 [Plakobranchus ocellatus]|uniref:Integral membrane protein gpr155 n=1 Tax=Plakobranchus ocellatus TaxID=259542 RepID=A0AAV3ZBQ2_9GAST|nr:integral membrane protein gpr155 [Plakobranchus ocellatus]